MKQHRLYPNVDPRALGVYYTDHLMAMTEADLYEKSDIAAQLAWRDSKIAALERQISYMRGSDISML